MVTVLFVLAKIIVSLLILACLFFLGYILNDVVVKWLKDAAKKTSWEGDDIIVAAMGGMPVVWTGIVGVYIFSRNIFSDPYIIDIIDHGNLIIFILSFTIVISRAVVDFVNLYAKKWEVFSYSTTLLQHCVQITVAFAGALVILQTLGISVGPLVTAFGIGGFTFAISIRETLSNMFIGIGILMSSGLKPGHYVKLENGEEGYIQDVTWKHTTVKTISDNIVIVPNTRLAGSIVKNYNLPAKEMVLVMYVRVGHDNDLYEVEKIALDCAHEVLKEIPGGVTDYGPFVYFEKMENVGVTMKVLIKIDEFGSKYPVRHEFMKKLHSRFKTAGVNFPNSPEKQGDVYADEH